MAPSPYAGRSDADLLWSAAADPEAFGAFFDRYEEPLLAFFVRATGRGELAVDLAAETFAAALESVGGFRPALGSAKGWLFGIARHHLADAWRRGAVEDAARRRLGMQPLALEDDALEAIERLGGCEGPKALALLAERRALARQPRPAHTARADRGRLVSRAVESHVPELRRALVVAAARTAPARADVIDALPARAATLRARRTIRHARRLPLLAAVLVLALLSAAVALAASGLIQIGAPVAPLPGQRFTPTTGYGVPIAGSVRLLPSTVPDPAGGPPWGLRYLQTTRGLGCVEVGRVVDGRLGVLGKDGSFGDDGRFHELPADVFEPLGCAPLDGRRQAFIALTFHGRPASGGDRFGCLPAGAPQQRTPVCPRADERLVSFGLLGPDARSLSYRAGALTRTIPIAAPLGAYLIVQPLAAPRGQTLGWVSPLASPGASPLTAVAYAGGRVCHIPPADRPGGVHPCPLVGWVAPSSARLTRAMLAAPVRARVGPLARGRHPRTRPASSHARWLHLTFTACAAVASARSRYLIELSLPRRCSHELHATRLSPVERDVRVGEAVHVGLALEPACPGLWSGSVVYVESPASGEPQPFATMRSMLDLGARAFEQSSPAPPLLVGRFSVVVR